MLLQAAKDFNIDLKQSWMIGDSETDVEAGTAAGCQCIRINNDAEGRERIFALLDAVKQILNENG